MPAWSVSSLAPGVTSSNSQPPVLGKGDVHWLIPMVRVPLFCSWGWGCPCFDSCSLSISKCKVCVGLFRDHSFFKDLAALVLKVTVKFAAIFKSREEEMCSVWEHLRGSVTLGVPTATVCAFGEILTYCSHTMWKRQERTLIF